MVCAGIDAGSRAIKIVVLNGDQSVLAQGVVDQGIQQDALAQELLDRLLGKVGAQRADLRRVVATGCARQIMKAAHRTVTEITCHARGVHHLMPGARTVVEIGGQDSKLLRLEADGSVRDFAMNDRCAAGTGSFLELVARRLGVGLGELGELARKSTQPAAITSMCAVFAETEIIGLLAGGAPVEDVVAGVQNAVASRIATMVGREVTPPVVFTGGVALVPGMAAALSAALGQEVGLCPQPQITGALGAALLAAGGK